MFCASSRTHRSAQHTAPTYLLITSDLAAEGRFAATIAKRAADLGAVTSADRRGTQANSIGSDLLVGPHAPAGIRSLFGALESTDSWPRWYADSGKPVGETTAAIRGAFESVRFEQDDKVKSLSNRLLGRMLGVPKYASNAAIEVYSAACEEAHAHARRNHNLKDDPVEDMTIDGQCVVLEETSEHTGIIRVTRDIGMPYQAALAKKEVAEANDMGTGFAYRVETRRNGRPDRVFNVLAVQTGAGARVRAWRPNGRVSEYYPSDFVEIYKSYDDEDAARAAWDYEHELTLTQCNHGCLDGKTCGTGTRCVESCLMPFPGVTNRLGGLYHPRTSLVRVKKADGARAVVVKVESHVADGLEKAAAKARADAAKDQQLRAQEAAKLAATAANAQAAEKAEDEEIEKACQAAEVAEAAKNPSPPPASMASTASTASAEPVTDVPEAKSIGGKRKAPPPPPAATSKKKVVSMAPQAAAAASSSSSRISRPKPQKQLSMRAFLVAHSDDSDDE